MYERANPFYENFLGGRIDMSRCHYEQYDERSGITRRAILRFGRERRWLRSNFVAARLAETKDPAQWPGYNGGRER